MNNNTVSTISRIVFALVIGYFGVGHLMNADGMKDYVPSYIPGGIIWVYVSGAGLLLAAIAFIIGVKVRMAGYLLGLLLLIIVLTIHLPGYLNAGDEAAKMGPMTMILKDTALGAAAFFIGSKSS